MNSRNKKIALGGVLGGLCVVFITLAVYVPAGSISIYAVSSLFCGVMVVEAGTAWAIRFYFTTSLLALFLVPNKVGIIPYLLFFGVYGIIKYRIEFLHNLIIEAAAKVCFFIASMAGLYYLAGSFFSSGLYSRLPLWAVLAAGTIVFFVYDYIYSRIMTYYTKNLRKRML